MRSILKLLNEHLILYLFVRRDAVNFIATSSSFTHTEFSIFCLPPALVTARKNKHKDDIWLTIPSV